MKKKLALVLIGLTVLVMALTACGGKDSKYVGHWTATKAEYAGVTMDVEEIFGQFELELESDGTAKATIKGQTEKGTWEESKNGVTLEGGLELKADGDKLTVEQDGVLIIFEKKDK